MKINYIVKCIYYMNNYTNQLHGGVSSGEGELGLGDTRVVIVTRRCWGVGDASVVIVGEGGGHEGCCRSCQHAGAGVVAVVVAGGFSTWVVGWWWSHC